MQETQVQSLCQEYPVEKGMATHSSILAWRIPWREDPSLWDQSQTCLCDVDHSHHVTYQTFHAMILKVLFVLLSGTLKDIYFFF